MSDTGTPDSTPPPSDPTQPPEIPTWSAPTDAYPAAEPYPSTDPYASATPPWQPHGAHAPTPQHPQQHAPCSPPPAAPAYAGGPYPQPYPQPGYPQAYGAAPYAQVAPTNVPAIVLLVMSGLLALSSLFTIGVPSGILAILGLTTNTHDPAGARRKTRIGWWVFGINLVLVAGAVTWLIVWAGVNGYLDDPAPYPTRSTLPDIGY